LAGEVIGDGPIVPRRVGERLGRQTPAKLQGGAAVAGDLVEDLGVLLRAGGDGREGRRPDHRRPADVDLLDGLVHGDAAAGDGGLERIEVHHDQLERDDAVFGQGLKVVGPVVAAEDAAVHLGVQGLQPPVHHLGEAGVVGDVADRDSLAFELATGAAGAEDFDADIDEPPGEPGQAQLVADADQYPLHGGRLHGDFLSVSE